MDIQNQTVFITGASSGIGKACAELFAKQKANLIITARRLDVLQKLSQRLSSEYGISCLPLKLDVQDPKQVASVFEEIEKKGLSIDILVNNAGLALSVDKLQNGKTENWDIVIDTNIKGLLYVTRKVLPLMIAKNQGHIINIGSVAGYECYTSGNVYCATKHAVRALSQCLRLDLQGTKIRVTEIAPGAVETEFSDVRFGNKEQAKKLYEGFDPLLAEDIADGVIYCATRPSHVNISLLTIYPQAQSSVSTIHREGSESKNLFSITK